MALAADVDPDELLAVARRAGEAILRIYAGEVERRAKADRSPVTAADEAAEEIILEALARLSPEVPVVAEESVAAGRVPDVGTRPFWLVDPLDGTREFLTKNGEFTVNIALVEDRVPTFGVVLAPALDVAWTGRRGHGAQRIDGEGPRPVAVRRADPARLVAVASRSHRDPETDAWLARHGIAETVPAGSSLKFCTVAEGRADVYPRFGPTMEWDTAAGQAVLEAAGGRVLTVDGGPLLYAKPEFRNPGFVAWGGLEPFAPGD
jgi:3'(2'), 5'-bisphosphate nucleotidase